jgi:hypothetical protein
VLSSYTTHQKTCANVLGEILDRAQAYEAMTGRDVPTLVWTVGFDGMSATVDEHSGGVGNLGLYVGCTLREGFDWWVEILRATVVGDRVESDGRRFLSASLRTDDIVVVLRTHLPAAEVTT